MARRKPRLVITVTTTVSWRSSPRAAQVVRDDRDDVVAVDDPTGVIDSDEPVGVAVESDAHVGASVHHRRGQQALGT